MGFTATIGRGRNRALLYISRNIPVRVLFCGNIKHKLNLYDSEGQCFFSLHGDPQEYLFIPYDLFARSVRLSIDSVYGQLIEIVG